MTRTELKALQNDVSYRAMALTDLLDTIEGSHFLFTLEAALEEGAEVWLKKHFKSMSAGIKAALMIAVDLEKKAGEVADTKVVEEEA